MVFKHILGLFTRPRREWEAIRDEDASSASVLAQVAILAAIPAIAAFIGSTRLGWQIAGSEPMKLAADSAAVMAVLYFVVILVAVYSVGWMIHWMAATYGAQQPLSRCIATAAYIPVPLFLIGVFQAYPVVWLNLVVALPALAYTVFLLYVGIPVMMRIPEERGFLFASAVMAVGLVGLVGMLAVTVILWGIGIGPAFVYAGAML